MNSVEKESEILYDTIGVEEINKVESVKFIMIELKNVNKVYDNAKSVLNDVNISFGNVGLLSLVKSGGVVGILITTILHIITPFVCQCFKIIKSCAEQNKLPILHYTLIKYDSYSLV